MIGELERKIIRVMNQNARKSYREIAKEVGTSVTAVINQVKKMEQSGVIKGYVPIVDPEHFGYTLIAVIAVRISKGKIIETQQIISEDERVSAVYDVTGEWDSLAVGYFKGRDDLNQFIKKVNSLRYVDRTVTHMVLNMVKDEKRVPV